MDTDDGKHYAVRYYVPHKPGKIRFYEDDYPEVYPTPMLDLRIGYSLEENKAEANITPENLTPDQRDTYIQVLEDALRVLKADAILGGGLELMKMMKNNIHESTVIACRLQADGRLSRAS